MFQFMTNSNVRKALVKINRLSVVWQQTTFEQIFNFQVEFIKRICWKTSPLKVHTNSDGSTIIKLSNVLLFKIISIINNLAHLHKLFEILYDLSTLVPNSFKKGTLLSNFMIHFMAFICCLLSTIHLNIRGVQQISLFNRLNKFESKVGLGTLNKPILKLVGISAGSVVPIFLILIGGVIFYLEGSFSEGFGGKFLFGIYQWWNFSWSITIGASVGIFALFASYSSVYVASQYVLR